MPCEVMTMNASDVSVNDLNEYLNYLITKFYQNDLQPYFDALCDDVLWIGPHSGQVIQGKEDLIKAFSRENGMVRYYLGLISTQTIRLSPTSAETISFFERTAFYPDSGPITFDLCYHLAWIKTDVWKMRVVNIFTQTPKYYEGSLYPVKPTCISVTRGSLTEESLHLKETGTGKLLFVSPSRIQWAESSSHHSVLHMDDKSILVSIELSRLAKMLESTHVRCHSCYIVNPDYVTSITRFRVTLSGNIILPVPEKKYTAVKRRIGELSEKKK
ncbi:MAG: hypothetical protein CW338_02100 [Clostridiales bacterium]|nr:hypothetical protein [Clostridiales bacterium]